MPEEGSSQGTPGSIRVGISGFSTIGRALFFAILNNAATNPATAHPCSTTIVVSHINDPFMTQDGIAYALKHENPYVPYTEMRVEAIDEEQLLVNDHYLVRVTKAISPSTIPWVSSSVTHVVECSGLFTTYERATEHLTAGVSCVVVAGVGSDLPLRIIGANARDSKAKIIATGAPIAVAVAPLLRWLATHFGTDECTFTAVHSGQPDITSASSGTMRQRVTRASLDTIIPQGSAAVESLQRALPAPLNSSIGGVEFVVPVTRGCAIDLTVRLQQELTTEQLLQHMSAASSPGGDLAGSVELRYDDLVSTDIGRSGTTILDANATMRVSTKAHKLLLWFDCVHGFAHRALQVLLETEVTGAA